MIRSFEMSFDSNGFAIFKKAPKTVKPVCDFLESCQPFPRRPHRVQIYSQ